MLRIAPRAPSSGNFLGQHLLQHGATHQKHAFGVGIQRRVPPFLSTLVQRPIAKAPPADPRHIEQPIDPPPLLHAGPHGLGDLFLLRQVGCPMRPLVTQFLGEFSTMVFRARGDEHLGPFLGRVQSRGLGDAGRAGNQTNLVIESAHGSVEGGLQMRRWKENRLLRVQMLKALAVALVKPL